MTWTTVLRKARGMLTSAMLSYWRGATSILEKL